MNYNYTLPINRIVNENLEDCNGDKGRAMFALACESQDLKDQIKRVEVVHDNRMGDLGFLIGVIHSLKPQGDSGYNALKLLDVIESLIIDEDGPDSIMLSMTEDIREHLVIAIQLNEKKEQKYNCRC